MTGKITRLPLEIRNQVNQRLANGQPANILLPWLNSLPEVQQVLKEQFDGEPITEQNLSAYRKHGFKRWELRQNALAFAAEAQDDSRAPAPAAAPQLLDQLVHYATLRFASAAQTAPIPDDPELDFQQAHRLLDDVVALRRGELIARRIALENRRIALVEKENQEELEELFWQWTRRSDINKRLYPHRDREREDRAIVHRMDELLFGIKSEPEPEPDPAAWI